MTPQLDSILTRNDAGESVAAIADALDVSVGYVYGVLREHRPNRARKARTRTSEKRRIVLGMLQRGHRPRRVAVLVGVTAAYVYRIASETSAVPEYEHGGAAK